MSCSSLLGIGGASAKWPGTVLLVAAKSSPRSLTFLSDKTRPANVVNVPSARPFRLFPRRMLSTSTPENPPAGVTPPAASRSRIEDDADPAIAVLRHFRPTPQSPRFPSFATLSRLNRTLYKHGLDIDNPQMETTLLQHFGSKGEATADLHPSGPTLALWRRGQRLAALEEAEELFLDLLATPSESLKAGLPPMLPAVHRVEYFLLATRWAAMLAEAVGAGRQAEIAAVRTVCHKASENHRHLDLTFLYWLTLVNSGQSRDLPQAQEMAAAHPDLHGQLMALLDYWSDDYTQLDEQPIVAVYKSMPAVFTTGNVEAFSRRVCDALPSSSADERDRLIRTGQIKAYQALAQWRAGRYSQSLPVLAEVLSVVSDHLQDGEVSTRLGPLAVTCASEMMRQATEHKMQPVLDYFNLVSDKLSHGAAFPLWSYVFQIHARNLSGEKGKEWTIEADLRDAEFEKCLLDKQMERDARRVVVEGFLNRLRDSFGSQSCGDTSGLRGNVDRETVKEIGSRDIAGDTEKDLDDGIAVSADVRRDMLDIQVLECVRAGHLYEAVALLAEATPKQPADSVSPASDVAVLALAEAILESQNWPLLDELKLAVPRHSSSLGVVLATELAPKLKRNHALWTEGRRRKEALANVLGGYVTLWDRELLLPAQDVRDGCLNRLTNYLRLYLEECVNLSGEEQEQLLLLVLRKGLELEQRHGDFSVLKTYWKSLFFSEDSHLRLLAGDLMAERPDLAKKLDVADLVERAGWYGKEEAFRRLVDLCSEQDLGDKARKTALEGLLAHQCERKLSEEAGNTIQQARSLGINLSADVKSRYEAMQAEPKPKISIKIRAMKKMRNWLGKKK